MKCRHVLQRLLATSGRRKLSPEALAHVAGCRRCQRWKARLGEIDRGVPQLPVPDSRAAKAQFIQQILAEPTTAVRPPWRVRYGVTWQRSVMAAAALVLFALLVSGVFNRERQPKQTAMPPDDFLAEIVERNVSLATAATPQKRIEELAILADRLEARTRNVARVAGTDDLNDLADLYAMVVSGDKGLVKRAGAVAEDMPAADKTKLIDPIAERLLRTSQEADRMSREVPPSAVASLQRIAAVAKQAHESLRKQQVVGANARQEKLADGRTPPVGEGKS